ncbi:MAG: hypothetical protein ACFFFH_19290 [Candidatus Thorarchaeota archaeon]
MAKKKVKFLMEVGRAKLKQFVCVKKMDQFLCVKKMNLMTRSKYIEDAWYHTTLFPLR